MQFLYLIHYVFVRTESVISNTYFQSKAITTERKSGSSMTFQQLDLRLSHDFAFHFTVENPGWNVSFSKLGKEESLHEYSLHFRVCSFKNVYRLHFFKDCLNSLNTKFH